MSDTDASDASTDSEAAAETWHGHSVTPIDDGYKEFVSDDGWMFTIRGYFYQQQTAPNCEVPVGALQNQTTFAALAARDDVADIDFLVPLSEVLSTFTDTEEGPAPTELSDFAGSDETEDEDEIEMRTVIERLEASPWPGLVEPVFDVIENDASLTADEWYDALKATNGQVALGFRQEDTDRVAQAWFWTPDEGLHVVSREMQWQGSIPELIDTLKTDGITPVPVPIERAHAMGGRED